MKKIFIATLLLAGITANADISEFERGYNAGKVSCDTKQDLPDEAWACTVPVTVRPNYSDVEDTYSLTTYPATKASAISALNDKCKSSNYLYSDNEGESINKRKCRVNIAKGNVTCKRIGSAH